MVDMSDVVEANESGFNGYIKDKKPMLVEFGASWCPPCKIMKPIVEQFSIKRPDVRFVAVDVDVQSKLADTYNVSSIPTFLLFKDGKVLGSTVGAVGEKGLTKLLEKLK
jgi:thioredoxin 1